MKTGSLKKLHALSSAMTERKSDAVRRSILDTFIALVGKIGFEKTTLDLVAGELKMRRNHVGYYYPSRSSLLSASVVRVISLGQQVTIQKIQAATDESSQLEAWVTAVFDWLKIFPAHGHLMLVFYSQCPFDPSLAKINEQIFEHGVERIRERVPSLLKSDKDLLSKLCMAQDYNVGLLIRKLTAPTKSDSWETLKEQAIEHLWNVLSLKKMMRKKR